MPTKADCVAAVTHAGVDPKRAEELVDFVLKKRAALKAAGQAVNFCSMQ